MATVIKRVLLVFICVLVLAVVLRNFWLKAAIEQYVFSVTGTPLKIKHFDIKLFQPEVNIQGMSLYNTSQFPDPVMAEVPEIYVKYNLSAISKGFLHFQEIRFNLDQFVVIRNEAGALNIDALKALQPPKGDGPPPKFQIDALELNLGKATFKDYTNAASPVVQEFPLNIQEKFSNIKSPEDLVKLIVHRALTKTSIARLADFDISGLKDSLSGSIEAVGQGLIDKTMEGLKDTINQLPWAK